MLRNILTLPVPAARRASTRERVLDDVLRAQKASTRERIDTWVMHAGGRKVLEELQRAARRWTRDDVRWSAPCCASTAT